VTALCEATDGRLWVVSRGGVLAVGDPRSERFRIATTLAARGRLTAVDALGPHVLVGTAAGLVAIDASSGRAVPLDAPLREAGLDAHPINVIRNARGVSFIASGKQVFRVTRGPKPGDALSVERLEPGTAGEVSALAASASGGLWMGSEAGDIVLAPGNHSGAPAPYRKLASDDGSLAAHGLITALHEDPQGRLWVGTRRGLGRIEPTTGKTAWFGDAEGLPSTTIAGITGDTRGFLWVATNRGLTRIDPRTGALTHFGEHEGAQENGYADGAWAAGKSGLLYFAGEGITAFDPLDVRQSPHLPGVVFTGLEILRRPVAPRWLDPDSPLERAIDSQTELTLGPSATVFSVEMAPLEYGDPPSNRLSYRLEGFDPEWIETDARNRVATYTRLEPGRYVLHARARTKSGLWSDKEARLAIHILPPWWRTRLALAAWSLLAALAAGLVWSEARRRTRVKMALLERETLRRESLTDPLTGLYNRRFLTTYLHHEVPKLLREYDAAGPAARSVPGLLLLLIDVDHFKKVNDGHTHAAGDRVLAAIAAVLRDHIRDSDLAVRWGGDEFLVVSRSFHLEHAAASVERLRVEVEALGLRLAQEGLPACTLSIGFAAFPFLVEEPTALTWEQTLDLADRALLLTKQRQRNSYTGLCARPSLTSAALIEALAAGSGAPLPEQVEVVVPDHRYDGASGESESDD
jgi:diguanylate cyclase (GGDEF)-like protein